MILLRACEGEEEITRAAPAWTGAAGAEVVVVVVVVISSG